MKFNYVPLTTDSYDLKNRKIVVVHKNRYFSDVLIAALNENQAKTSYFNDPKEGLKHVIKNKSDVIVSDMTMEEMDGLKFLKKLKLVRNTPVIFLTKCTAFSIVSEAYNLGCTDYIYEHRASVRDIINSIRYVINDRYADNGISWEEGIEVFGNEDLLFKELKQGPLAESYVLYFNGEKAFLQDDFTTAVFLYKKAYEMGLRHVRLYTKAAISYYQLKEYKKGLKWAKRAVKADYNNHLAIQILFSIYKELGEEEKAKKLVKRRNRARFFHPTGYIFNRFKINQKYFSDTKLLFLTTDSKRVKILIDNLGFIGADIDVKSKYPSRDYIKRKGYSFIVLDLSNSSDGMFKFVRSIKSLEIPTISIGQNITDTVLDELKVSNIDTHVDLNLYNTRGIAEVIRLRLERGED